METHNVQQVSLKLIFSIYICIFILYLYLYILYFFILYLSEDLVDLFKYLQ